MIPFLEDELVRYTLVFLAVHNLYKTTAFRVASMHLVNVVNEFLKPFQLYLTAVSIDPAENLRRGLLPELIILGATFYMIAFIWRTSEYKRKAEQKKLYGGMKSSEPKVNYN